VAIPVNVHHLLTTVGQVATELPIEIDGYREFVSVFYFSTNAIHGFESQYAYLKGCTTSYRVVKFRVDATLCENDAECCTDDLVGVQSIVVASEVDVENILAIWKVDPHTLRLPRDTDVPL
jgi:hypothetical protein